MMDLEVRPKTECSPKLYATDRPIDFEAWLQLSYDTDTKTDTELVGGVIKTKMAAKYPREWIFAWLFTIISNFVNHLHLGRALGSRTPVKINAYSGRLPDILFVRTDNLGIIQDDAIYGTPDLVIEIVSDNDRPSTLIPLEADYRSIGISEIVFIDPKKNLVRYLLKNEMDYEETLLTTGQLKFAAIPGFHIEVERLFVDMKPDCLTLVNQLVAENK